MDRTARYEAFYQMTDGTTQLCHFDKLESAYDYRLNNLPKHTWVTIYEIVKFGDKILIDDSL